MPADCISPGRTFSRFRIEEHLGAGGMGVVYRAVDTRLGRSVALKFLSSIDALETEARQRFLREARAASTLDHPSIGAIYGIEEGENGELCIVMAYYDGETLAARLSRGRMPVAEALRIAIAVADGLAEAHRHGIIHRDIKPSNILLTRSGGVKIVDFGLATCTAAQDDALTQPQAVIGTAAYMSPEQARGETVDARADIWSLGAVLYEMLAGRRPFTGASAFSLLRAVVNDSPAPLHIGITQLDRAVGKALEKPLRQRYASARQFASDLRRISDALDVESSHPTLPVAVSRSKPSRSRKLWVAAAMLAAALGITAPLAFRTAPETPTTLAITPFAGGDERSSALARGLAQSVRKRIAQLERFNGSLVVFETGDNQPQATVTVAGVLTRANTGALRLDLRFNDTRASRAVDSIVEDRGGDPAALEQRAAGQIAAMLDLRTATQLRTAAPAGRKAYEAYLRGLGYLQRWDKPGNLDSAIAAFTEAVTQDNDFALAYAGLAEASRTRYRADQDSASLQHALNYANQAVRMSPALIEGRVALGRTLQDASRRDAAIEEFQQALKLDDRNSAALLGMARAYEDMGKMAEAEATFRQAVTLSPYWWSARNNLAIFYIRQKRYYDAEAQLRRAIALTPDNAALYSNLGLALARQDRLKDAVQAFERSITLSPTYAAHCNVGSLHFRARRFDQAAGAYEKALRLNARDFRVWGAKAQALRLADGSRDVVEQSYRTAIRLAEQSLEASPEQPRTASLLATYYAALGDRPGAARAIERALQQGRADRDVQMDVATAYQLLGDTANAARAANSALAQGYPMDDIRTDPDLAPLVRSGALNNTGGGKG